MGKKGHCRESKKKKKKKQCAMSKFGIFLSLALLCFFLSQGDAKHILVETEGEGADLGDADAGLGDLPEVENRQLDVLESFMGVHGAKRNRMIYHQMVCLKFHNYFVNGLG